MKLVTDSIIDEVATTNGEFVRTKRAYKKRPVVVNDMGSRKKRKSDGRRSHISHTTTGCH